MSLTPAEKATLRGLLEHPVMQKAMEEAINTLFHSKRNAGTLETCAMAYNYNEGGFAALALLQEMGEIEQPRKSPVPIKRFRPIQDEVSLNHSIH